MSENPGTTGTDYDVCVCGHQEGDHHMSWIPGMATTTGEPFKMIEECEFWYLDEPCSCEQYKKEN